MRHFKTHLQSQDDMYSKIIIHSPFIFAIELGKLNHKRIKNK